MHIAHLSVRAGASDRHPDLQWRARQVIHIMPVTGLGHEVEQLVRIAAIDVNDIEIVALALD